MSIRSLTQEDPLGLADGLNLYGFAGGDPINFSDPFGLQGCSINDRSDCPILKVKGLRPNCDRLHRDCEFREMLQMRSIARATFCAVVTAALAVRLAPGQAECKNVNPTRELAQALADILIKRAGLKGTRSPTSDVHAASIPVRVDGNCVIAYTLSWNDGFDGGVVLLGTTEREGMAVFGAAPYDGASHPIPAGRGRVAFSYSGGRGSGQVSERTAVLCSLAVDNWVLCADVLTHQDVVGSGYPPSDSLSSGMGFVMRSKVSVVADTLVISSDVVMKAYGKHPARHGTLVAKHPLPYNGRFFLSS